MKLIKMFHMMTHKKIFLTYIEINQYKGEKIMWETLRKEEVLQKLKTDKRGGLAKQEVENRQKEYGKTN